MLVYSAICSLDGYTADVQGGFQWCAPDDEVHAFVNELERPIGTYLLGRRMYEVMRYWEDPPEGHDEVSADYARIWQAADKVVYSTTLDEVRTAHTRLERCFDPQAVRALSEDARVSVGGAHLAGQAIAAGLVNEIHLFRAPVLVGGGLRALPEVHLDLRLVEQRAFGNGTTYSRYDVLSDG